MHVEIHLTLQTLTWTAVSVPQEPFHRVCSVSRRLAAFVLLFRILPKQESKQDKVVFAFLCKGTKRFSAAKSLI